MYFVYLRLALSLNNNALPFVLMLQLILSHFLIALSSGFFKLPLNESAQALVWFYLAARVVLP
jgi:hypothetical protein